MGNTSVYINGNIIEAETVRQIAEIGAKAGVDAYKKELEREKRKREKEADKVSRTKKMLKSYRRIKKKLSDNTKFTEDEEIEFRWKFLEDLMGNVKDTVGKTEMSIKGEEKSRQEDAYCIYRIEKAVELYREECEAAGNDEAMRRYRELSMMFLEDKIYSVKEISTVENVSEKTVYKDIGIACGIVAMYLLGI